MLKHAGPIALNKRLLVMLMTEWADFTEVDELLPCSTPKARRCNWLHGDLRRISAADRQTQIRDTQDLQGIQRALIVASCPVSRSPLVIMDRCYGQPAARCVARRNISDTFEKCTCPKLAAP